MRWDVTYTHVFCAREKGCRIRVTHVHMRSDCVYTMDDTVRLNYASRCVRVIYSSHIVSIKQAWYHDTPPSLWTGKFPNDKTVQLQWGYPHSSRRCCLAVLPALALTLPSARPQAVLPACLLALQLRCLPSSLKQCCPLQRGSRSGGATRTRPGGATRTRQNLPCSSGSASLHVPRRCSRTRPDGAFPASVSFRSLAPLHAGALTVLLTRVATLPRWQASPGLGGGPTLALLRSFSQAEFTSPSSSWRLMEDGSCSSSFPTQHPCCFLHCLPLSVSQRHSTHMLLRCYPPTSLV